MRVFALRAVIVIGTLLFAISTAAAAERLYSSAVASAHPLATQAGYEILHAGGNAFDAAVAVSAALAVVEPFSSGIGGGGFYLLHRASDGFEVMVDAREKAPLLAERDMYLGADGKAIASASLEGARAAAIPGLPAGLAWLAQRYGILPLQETLAPAIRLAEQGFIADVRYLSLVKVKESLLAKSAESATIFLDNGKTPQPGFRLAQPELGRTLRALASEGHDGFYKGAVAQKLVAATLEAGGLWQLQDLSAYAVVERQPTVITAFGGIKITTASLPSSGGATLAQSLNILEGLPLAHASQPQRAHFVSEAMRRAYHDRARHLGDSDFVDVPVALLTSKSYAAARAKDIDAHKATPSNALDEAPLKLTERDYTTHFSVVDHAGNRVAATLSINGLFGSGFVAGTTGVLLNNEMDDFSVAPGTPNLYGLVGGEANAIAPQKRPLSSMSPTFVEDQRGVLVLGTPGGSRIISMVLLAILNYALSAEPNVDAIVAAPRFHHQYLPDRIEIEPQSFGDAWIKMLESKGHSVKTGERRWGNMQAVFVDKQTLEVRAASDPRGADAWR